MKQTHAKGNSDPIQRVLGNRQVKPAHKKTNKGNKYLNMIQKEQSDVLNKFNSKQCISS